MVGSDPEVEDNTSNDTVGSMHAQLQDLQLNSYIVSFHLNTFPISPHQLPPFLTH